MNKEIIFFKVTNGKEKLLALINMVRHHFFLSQRVLVACPNEEVATYIDKLLWSEPNSSFLPHSIKNEPTDEFIIISWMKENLNRATVLVNLCTEFYPSFQEFPIVYELYDETHPVKEELSKARNSYYQTQGFKTSIRVVNKM